MREAHEEICIIRKSVVALREKESRKFCLGAWKLKKKKKSQIFFCFFDKMFGHCQDIYYPKIFKKLFVYNLFTNREIYKILAMEIISYLVCD